MFAFETGKEGLGLNKPGNDYTEIFRLQKREYNCSRQKIAELTPYRVNHPHKINLDMFNWLQESFEQNSIMWLLLSSTIGGIAGATTKFLFDFLLPQEITKKLQTRKLLKKYRNPILRSGLDLQSRLFNIIDQSFLQIYCNKNEEEKEYAIKSTLYVIAEFLGWKEILRREVQFLDFGNVKSSRELEKLLNNVSRQFTTDAIDFIFRLPKGYQRAIGEIMIKEGNSLECIGFAEFVLRLNTDSEFSKWLAQLTKDIEMLASQGKDYGERIPSDVRLVEIHNALVNLLIFLDSNYIYVPEKRMRLLPSITR